MYYIDGKDLEEAKAKFEEARKEKARKKEGADENVTE